MAKTINVAMIGYQFMGRAHANAWRQVNAFFDLPVEARLQVVCGRRAPEVARAASKLGFASHATDWREVVERPEIDVVDICTPGDSHVDIAIAAAAAGKHVFCEKPLANSVEEAERMLASVERAGVIHMVCHNYRRAPAVALAKQLIEEGRLGRIRHYRGTYLQDWIADPSAPLVWRLQRAKAGSGALGDIGSHSLDLARHLVGEVVEVSGLLETFVSERPLENGGGTGRVDVDDAALALIRFEEGAIGSIEGTRFAPGRKNFNRFEINGSLGSLAFDLERMNELEFYEEAGPNSGFRTILATNEAHPYISGWWPAGHIIGYEHTFTHTVRDLMLAITSGQLPEPNFGCGLRNQQVLDAIERSAASRSWLRV